MESNAKIIDNINSINDLIEFYESIPEEKWITNYYSSRVGCCALGHLGMRYYKIDNIKIVDKLKKIGINDNELIRINDIVINPSTPKERVINFLKSMNK